MKSNNITFFQILSKIPRLLSLMPAIFDVAKSDKRINKNPKTEPLGTGWVLEKTAKKYPERTAVLYEDRKISYKDFNEWSNRITHFLSEKGMGKGKVVAMLMENRPEYLAYVAGVAKTGAVNALVNNSQTGKPLAHSFNIVKPDIYIIGEECVGNFEEIKMQLQIEPGSLFFIPLGDSLTNYGKEPEGYINIAKAIKDYPTANPETTNFIYKKDPCFYIFTSGTTGLPKAAIVIHGRVMMGYNGFCKVLAHLKPTDVVYCTLPLYHLTGLLVCWGSALVAGGAIALRRKFSAREFWNDIKKYNATCFGYVGELCRYLMNQPENPDDADNPVVKIIGNGMRPAIWKDFKKRFGIKEVLEVYAVSEGNIAFVNIFNFDNTVGCCFVPYAIIKYDKENDRPVLDKDGFMQKVGKGEEGLLISWISDKNPFDGYTDKYQSNNCVIRNVFANGDIWYKTGDLLRNIGYRHAQFVDRLGDTYRWKGENVSTTEVENILSLHESIEEVIAYGVEIPNTNGRAGMVSVVLKQTCQGLDCSGIYHYMKDMLPSYAVPLFIRIRSSMLTTGTFKYKKTDLQEQSYKISKYDDECYALLPGKDQYIKVTEQIVKDINCGTYKY